MAMVLFYFFTVEMTVRDIITLVHPWKKVQPFAAMKMEHTRGFVVGWRTCSMYRVENKVGQHLQIAFQIMSKTMTFAYKVYLYYYTQSHPIVLVAIASSTLSIVLGWQKLVSLLVNRRELKSFIDDKLEDEKLPKNEKQSLVGVRRRHFGERQKRNTSQEPSTPVRPKLAKAETEELVCHKCGRRDAKCTPCWSRDDVDDKSSNTGLCSNTEPLKNVHEHAMLEGAVCTGLHILDGPSCRHMNERQSRLNFKLKSQESSMDSGMGSTSMPLHTLTLTLPSDVLEELLLHDTEKKHTKNTNSFALLFTWTASEQTLAKPCPENDATLKMPTCLPSQVCSDPILAV